MSDSTWDPSLAGGHNSPPSAAELAAAAPSPVAFPSPVAMPTSTPQAAVDARNAETASQRARDFADMVYGENTYNPAETPPEFTQSDETQPDEVLEQNGEQAQAQAPAPPAAATDAAMLQVVQTLVQALTNQGQSQKAEPVLPPAPVLSPAAKQAAENQAMLERFYQDPGYRAELFERLNAQRGVAKGDPAYLDPESRRDLEAIEGRLHADAKLAAQEARLEALELKHTQELQRVRFEAIAQQADQLFERQMAPFSAAPREVQDQLATRVADAIRAGQAPATAIAQVFADPLTKAYLQTLGKLPTPPKAPAKHAQVEQFIRTPDRNNGRSRPNMKPAQRLEMMERGIMPD